MTTFPVIWTDRNGAPRQTDITQSDNTPDPSLIVLLLHGMAATSITCRIPASAPA